MLFEFDTVNVGFRRVVLARPPVAMVVGGDGGGAPARPELVNPIERIEGMTVRHTSTIDLGELAIWAIRPARDRDWQVDGDEVAPVGRAADDYCYVGPAKFDRVLIRDALSMLLAAPTAERSLALDLRDMTDRGTRVCLAMRCGDRVVYVMALSPANTPEEPTDRMPCEWHEAAS